MNSLDKILDDSYISVNIDTHSTTIIQYLHNFIDAECTRIGMSVPDFMSKFRLVTKYADQFQNDFYDEAHGNIFYWNSDLEIEEAMPAMLSALLDAETGIRQELKKGAEHAYPDESWRSWYLMAGMRKFDDRLAVVSSKEACLKMQKLNQEMDETYYCGDNFYGNYDNLHCEILSSTSEAKKPSLAA